MKLLLRDINQDMVNAWKTQFKDCPEVDIACESIFDTPSVEAYVSPANSFGFFDGGIDLAYRNHFSKPDWDLQEEVQKYLALTHYGELPVGFAMPIRVSDKPFTVLIVAPTMRLPTYIGGTINVYLAFRAAMILGMCYRSVACPGMGTGVGGMDYTIAASQMRFAYDNIVLRKAPLTARDILIQNNKLLFGFVRTTD